MSDVKLSSSKVTRMGSYEIMMSNNPNKIIMVRNQQQYKEPGGFYVSGSFYFVKSYL